MNKSLLSIGIVLALGSVGCAGFGMQQSSNFAPTYTANRGVDELWLPEEESATGVEPRLYAEQELGALWDGTEHAPKTEVDARYDGGASSDLWNSASTRGWTGSDERSSSGYELSRTSGSLWY